MCQCHWELYKLLEKCGSCCTCSGIHDYHWKGVAVGRECDSPLGGLKVIRKACQSIQTCGNHRRCEEVWRGLPLVSKSLEVWGFQGGTTNVMLMN